MQDVDHPEGLSAAAARVLGCLIEKEATTPDSYPLTLNALRNACNQSTSRNPVVSYDDHDVERALATLRERGLTRTVHSPSNRVAKYRHVVPESMQLEPCELALISVLLLRGPQTLGELKSRTDRQHQFDSVDDVAAALAGLHDRDRPLVLQLERQPGQKDARWIELLSSDHAQCSANSSTGAAATADDVSAVEDPYGQATAEFYDLLATAHWKTFGVQLLELLSGADPSDGPILDVGVGTGVGLRDLLVSVPGARIHAVEPSRAMRTALHTRLALDDDLRRAVTVEPQPFGRARLPDRCCALVASAALGHFTDAERARLWRYVAEQMPAGAPAVIEVLPPERPIHVPPTRYRELAVGAYRYEGWQQGEPADEHHMAWTMTYRVLDGETEVASSSVRSRWRCLSIDDVRAEIQPFGLTLTEHEDCVVVTRPAQTAYNS